MTHWNHMSPAQRAFVRRLRNGEVGFEQLKHDLKINDKRMARWFRGKYFWKEVKRAMRERMRPVWLATKLAVSKAETDIAEALGKGGGVPSELRESYDLAKKHCREDDKLELARRRRRRKKKPPFDSHRDLVHPDFKHLEKELLAMAKKNWEADKL